MSDNSRVRVSLVGVVIVALFSSLLVRLWFLQMGPEQKLRAQAIALATRKIQSESPRGRILDRNGNVLARDRAAWAVTLDRDLKTRTRERVLGQLSELIGVEPKDLRDNYQSPRQSPLRPAIIAIDIPSVKRLEILEHQDEYPGVGVVLLTVREYPIGSQLGQPALAAQVLGYVGEIDRDQLKTLKRKGYQAGDLLGRDGVEAAYESVLRGKPKVESVQIDPRGEQIGPGRVIQEGAVGNDVSLTIDADLQLRAERALAAGILQAREHQNENPEVTARGYETLKAPGGAVIVLDAQNGSMHAMASFPAFDPASWIGGIRQEQFDWVNDPANHFPLVNRATQGQYAPGSTFKLVSALAMNRYGVRPHTEYYVDEGEVFIGNQWFYNDKSVSNGPVALAQALTVSSDTYFYTAGDEFWHAWNAGDVARGLGMQDEARNLGFDAKTGIEIDETTGRIPDPDWKKEFADANYQTAKERNDYGRWYPGDEVHLAVGQGDVLVTPLQLATAYAAFANGGALVTPHVGMTVKDAQGALVRDIAPKPRGLLPIDPNVRAEMLAGFKSVVQSEDPLGTAYWAFNGLDEKAVGPGGIAGKTGSAQVAGKGPTSWFVSFFPADAPKYVVLAVVEEGGYGAEIAAPIVRQVIEYLVNPNAPPTPIPDLSDRGRD
jgi:penicillin-binding protein 2